MALERVADGVWLLRGDLRKSMNGYFLEEEGGGRGGTGRRAGGGGGGGGAGGGAAELGGLKRIVLGHAHADHRGTAPGLDVPVYCHPDEGAEAESDPALWP